jgi:hypothetical protein
VPSGSPPASEPLAAAHLGGGAGGKQVRLVELRQGVDRQALHQLVGALHRRLVPSNLGIEVGYEGMALAGRWEPHSVVAHLLRCHPQELIMRI